MASTFQDAYRRAETQIKPRDEAGEAKEAFPGAQLVKSDPGRFVARIDVDTSISRYVHAASLEDLITKLQRLRRDNPS